MALETQQSVLLKEIIFGFKKKSREDNAMQPSELWMDSYFWGESAPGAMRCFNWAEWATALHGAPPRGNRTWHTPMCRRAEKLERAASPKVAEAAKATAKKVAVVVADMVAAMVDGPQAARF